MKPIDCQAGRLLLMCSVRFCLRSGEAFSRRLTDVVEATAGPVLLMQPLRGSPLKTASSTRAIDMGMALGDAELQEFVGWTALRKQETGSAAPRGQMLLTMSDTENHGPASVAETARAALRLVAAPDSARLHAGRHMVACAGFHAVMQNRRGHSEFRYAGLRLPPWLSAVQHHDPAVQLYALARWLGHATPLTTLTHYVHLIGYLEQSDGGWPRPSAQGFALLALAPSYGAFRTRISRTGGRLATMSVSGLIRDLGLAVESVTEWSDERTFAPIDRTPNKAGPRQEYVISHSVLSEILLGFAAGSSRAMQAARQGLSRQQIDTIVQEVLVLQEQYRYWLLSVRDEGELKKARRRPRPQLVGEYLARCDQITIVDSLRWRIFVDAIKRQTRLDGRIFVMTGEYESIVREVLQEIIDGEVSREVLDSTGLTVVCAAQRTKVANLKGLSRAAIGFMCFVVLLHERLCPYEIVNAD